jgi:hypothetical protein
MSIENQITDANSINIANDDELQYWTHQLKLTNDKLREAVKGVGDRIKAIKVFLNKA